MAVPLSYITDSFRLSKESAEVMAASWGRKRSNYGRGWGPLETERGAGNGPLLARSGQCSGIFSLSSGVHP
jgi:hypothetical protein